ncbi:MAG: transglutaminase family protein [Gammaproteobacteria bacterium]|nr:transglutaminase family protein [Gammaproteobacteria bacterium]
MPNKWLHVTCAFSFDVAVNTPMVFMLRPRSGPSQWVAGEEYRLSPSVQVVEYADGFGNLCQRLIAPVGEFHINTSADVMVIDQPSIPTVVPYIEVPELPDEVLAFLLPSRYCESDRFGQMATEIVGDSVPGYAQVTAITDWVDNRIRYTPLSSTFPISAIEVHEKGEGVCRDLAHIAIALCRALCIPARLVVGYLENLEPMDIHAWIEAFVGGRWYTFDPVRSPDNGGRIAIAHGRDATDVAIYNQYGPLLLPRDMRVTVEEFKRED